MKAMKNTSKVEFESLTTQQQIIAHRSKVYRQTELNDEEGGGRQGQTKTARHLTNLPIRRVTRTASLTDPQAAANDFQTK